MDRLHSDLRRDTETAHSINTNGTYAIFVSRIQFLRFAVRLRPIHPSIPSANATRSCGLGDFRRCEAEPCAVKDLRFSHFLHCVEFSHRFFF
jgi:hypothetical protein